MVGMSKLLQKNLIVNCKIGFRLDLCCSGVRTFSSWSTDDNQRKAPSSSSNMEKHYSNSDGVSTRNDHSYYYGKDRRSSLNIKEQLSSSTKSFHKIKRGFTTWRGKDFGRDRDFNRYGSHDSNPDRDQRSLCGYFGGDHLYGISSVRIALLSGKRVITELLVQEKLEFKKKDKRSIANEEILKSADSQNIKVRYMPLHDLNLVTENRDHQGYVLRAAPLDFKNIDSLEKSNSFQCVLALDEVMDPQNFGALLRTSHFLGVQKVIICGKNSAPMTPTVSNVSSGALEIIDINFVDNLGKFLERSQANGWQIIGTSLSGNSIDTVPFEAPTILVLGNEGSGVRPVILQKCSHLVKINGDLSTNDSEFNVDSLNVSVSGGILLYHILKKKM